MTSRLDGNDFFSHNINTSLYLNYIKPICNLLQQMFDPLYDYLGLYQYSFDDDTCFFNQCWT